MNQVTTTINSTTFDVSTRSITAEQDLVLTYQYWNPRLEPIVVGDEALALERFVVIVDSLSFDGPDKFSLSMYHQSKKGLRDDLNTLIEYRKTNMNELNVKLASYWPLFDYDEDNLGVDDSVHAEYLAMDEKHQLLRNMRFEVNGKYIPMAHFDDDCTFQILTLDEWFDGRF